MYCSSFCIARCICLTTLRRYIYCQLYCNNLYPVNGSRYFAPKDGTGCKHWLKSNYLLYSKLSNRNWKIQHNFGKLGFNFSNVSHSRRKYRTIPIMLNSISELIYKMDQSAWLCRWLLLAGGREEEWGKQSTMCWQIRPSWSVVSHYLLVYHSFIRSVGAKALLHNVAQRRPPWEPHPPWPPRTASASQEHGDDDFRFREPPA